MPRLLSLLALCVAVTLAGCDYLGSGHSVTYRAEAPGTATIKYRVDGELKEVKDAGGSWSKKIRAEEGEALQLIVHGSTFGPTRATIEVDGKVVASKYSTSGDASASATAGNPSATL